MQFELVLEYSMEFFMFASPNGGKQENLKNIHASSYSPYFRYFYFIQFYCNLDVIITQLFSSEKLDKNMFLNVMSNYKWKNKCLILSLHLQCSPFFLTLFVGTFSPKCQSQYLMCYISPPIALQHKIIAGLFADSISQIDPIVNF